MDAGDLGQQGLLALVQAFAAAHHGPQVEEARLRIELRAGGGLLGDLLFVDQAVVEPGGLAARQDGVEHGQGGGVGISGLRRLPGDGDGRQRHVGGVAGDGPGTGAGRLLDGDPLQRRGGLLQGAEVGVDPGVQLPLIEVADHDQGGVVGPIVGGVKGKDVVDGGGVEILDRADDRAAIGVDGVAGRRHQQGLEATVGVGQHPLAQFLLHHVALGLEVGLVDHQRTHPLGLGPQQPLQVVGRDQLVVGGHVVGGEGVVEAADVLGHAVDGFRRQIPGGLEHQVLEQVGEAGAALRIILAANAVPDLDRDVGRRAINRADHPQAVGQHALAILDRRGGRQAVGGQSLKRRGDQSGGKAEHQGGGEGFGGEGFQHAGSPRTVGGD